MYNQWCSPIGRKAARRQCSSGERAIEVYGDIIWEYITAIGCYGETFRRADVEQWFGREMGFAKRTATLYVGAFFAYCRAVPEQFSGPASVLTKSGCRFYLADADEK